MSLRCFMTFSRLCILSQPLQCADLSQSSAKCQEKQSWQSFQQTMTYSIVSFWQKMMKNMFSSSTISHFSDKSSALRGCPLFTLFLYPSSPLPSSEESSALRGCPLSISLKCIPIQPFPITHFTGAQPSVVVLSNVLALKFNKTKD